MSVLERLRTWWTDRHDLRVSASWLEMLADQEERAKLDPDRVVMPRRKPPAEISDYTRTA